MITFFRKIREKLLSEGKTGKYIKYAIGEIFLVVMGILLALQINIWNEERKEAIRVTSFLTKMSKDIKSDIEYYVENDSLYAIFQSESRKAMVLFNQAKTVKEVIIVDSLFQYKWRDLPVNRSTYDEMLNTGSLYTLKNKLLQDNISEYYKYIESQQYYIKQINTVSQELFFNPNLSSLSLLYAPISRRHPDYNKIDTSWIGDVNAPTSLALFEFYAYTLGSVIGYRRLAFKGILNRGNNLIHEIENELDRRD